MSDLGDVVVKRGGDLGGILGIGAIAVPAVVLFASMLINADLAHPSDDELKGLAMVGIFALVGTIALYANLRLRFELREKGIRARKLFSTLELPFDRLAAISVKRTAGRDKDLRTGEVGLGYEVTVWDDTEQSAQFQSRGFGSNAEVEGIIRQMETIVTQRFRTQHERGTPVHWLPGVIISDGQVRGQVVSQAGQAGGALLLALEDDSVAVQLERGQVGIFQGQNRVASFGCDTRNYFPGVQLLREVSAWSIHEA